jgi:hypothetical protein
MNCNLLYATKCRLGLQLIKFYFLKVLIENNNWLLGSLTRRLVCLLWICSSWTMVLLCLLLDGVSFSLARDPTSFSACFFRGSWISFSENILRHDLGLNMNDDGCMLF